MEATEIPARLKELSLCIEELNNKFYGLMMRKESQYLRSRIEALNNNQETVKKMFEKLKQGFVGLVSRIEELKKEGDEVKERLNELMTPEEDSGNKDFGYRGLAPSISATSDDVELGLSTNIEGLKEKMLAVMSLTQRDEVNKRLLEWAKLDLLDSDED